MLLLESDFLRRAESSIDNQNIPPPESNLPRLLQFQFLVASTLAQYNPALALSLLNYICAATKESEIATGLNIHASTLLSSIGTERPPTQRRYKCGILASKYWVNAKASAPKNLVVQSERTASYVPSVNPNFNQQISKVRLVSALDFDNAFRHFVTQTRADENVVTTAIPIRSPRALRGAPGRS